MLLYGPTSHFPQPRHPQIDAPPVTMWYHNALAAYINIARFAVAHQNVTAPYYALPAVSRAKNGPCYPFASRLFAQLCLLIKYTVRNWIFRLSRLLTHIARLTYCAIAH